MKRTLLFVLSIVLVLAILPISAFAADEAPATPEGTAIKNATQLSEMEANGNYYLANDILITGEWESPKNFSGTLDGNNHVIVYEGATVKGGLFVNLAGGTVKNLSITESAESKSDENKANTFTPKGVQLDALYTTFGGVAGYGYGTIENVTVALEIITKTEAKVGGLLGISSDGDVTAKNCISICNISTGTTDPDAKTGTTQAYAGGMVAECRRMTSNTLSFENCVNYSTIYATESAGGMLGHDRAQLLNFSAKSCVNYGTMKNNAYNQVAGICGYRGPSATTGTTEILNCINYGSFETLNVKPVCGGILGNIRINDSTAVVKGNVNYPETLPTSQNSNGPIVANPYGGTVDAANNYATSLVHAFDQDGKQFIGELIDDNTLATLNAAYPDTYEMVEGKIALKWMSAAGLSATAPTITYTIPVGGDDATDETTGAETGNNEQPTVTDAPTGTNAPEVTEAPTTGDSTKEPASNNEGGCSSVIGGGAVLGILAACGLAAVIRKKED